MAGLANAKRYGLLFDEAMISLDLGRYPKLPVAKQIEHLKRAYVILYQLQCHDQALVAEKALVSLGHEPELPQEGDLTGEKPSELKLEVDLGAEEAEKERVLKEVGLRGAREAKAKAESERKDKERLEKSRRAKAREEKKVRIEQEEREAKERKKRRKEKS